MSEMVSDFFEAQTLRNQTRGTGMSQSVGTPMLSLNGKRFEFPVDYVVQCHGRQGPLRRMQSEKYLGIGRRWPDRVDVPRQSFCHGRQQWIDLRLPALMPINMQNPRLPGGSPKDQ